MKKYICTLFAILSFSYYLWLGFHNSFRMSVLPFWLLLSILFILIGYRENIPLLKQFPPFLCRIIKTVLLIALFFFLLVESFVLWGMTRKPGENLDYLIVLGAGLKGDKPSSVLEQRLECAYKYLETHPDTLVIVSGGQGPTEVVSEAESMKNWLLQKGIHSSRIIMEDNSTTTAENMRYSFAYIKKEPGNIGIVTNNFHVFRSLCIANHSKEEAFGESENYKICGMAADFPALLLPHYMVREFFTICVDSLLGNM